MSKHKKEETTITETTAKNAEEELEKARDPGNVPEPGEQSPETAGGGQPSEEAGDAGTAAETGAAPSGEGPGDVRPLSAEERIAELEAKLAEATDQYLRKAADFENYRKRMNQEKQNAIDYANQTLFQDLILVIDDFERAIKSAESQREAAGGDGEQIAAGYNSLYEGITMIEKNLVSQLENKWGLKRFDSAGEPFDPNRHEAIMMEKSADVDEPVVAEDFIKGYILKDRVIRPAKVKVVMPENK
ncbi:MAG: nucleotide exchange factor GrpE [Treponema sp.]|jgi:molecular chaperone GrpE|nr:nucleotide exchange factor GrpE [Treponema sp.]